MASILLVTHDPTLAAQVTQALSMVAHAVTTADSRTSAVAAAVRAAIHLVIADALIDGLRELRELLAGMPFVFIGAGAVLPGRLPMKDGDQVVGRPLSDDDLRAAVVAALRSAPASGTRVELGGIVLDRQEQRLLAGGRSVQLTPIEFQLIDYLAQVRGGIASAEELLQYIWRYAPGTGSSEVVRSHLKNLRSKLRRLTVSPDMIQTVPRRGYRLAL